jgi:beta-glucanase (GH16 family)
MLLQSCQEGIDPFSYSFLLHISIKSGNGTTNKQTNKRWFQKREAGLGSEEELSTGELVASAHWCKTTQTHVSLVLVKKCSPGRQSSTDWIAVYLTTSE